MNGSAIFYWLQRGLPVTAVFLVLICAWYAVKFLFVVPEYILPGPSDVFAATFSRDIPWLLHIKVTAWEILAGFALSSVVGVGLGVMIAWSPMMSRSLLPFLVFVNTLPKIAIAPLILLWFGYGLFPNALIAASIGFFPVVINSAAGLRQTPDEMLDLGAVFGAPKWKVFLKIRFPMALPYILTSLKVSATLCVVGVIVGEFIASQSGLGSVIVNSQTTLNTPVAFAAIVWISVLGLVVYGAVGSLGRLIAPWAETSTS